MEIQIFNSSNCLTICNYNDTVSYSSMNVNVFTAAARSGRGLAVLPRHSSSRLDGRGTVSAGAAAGDVLNA